MFRGNLGGYGILPFPRSLKSSSYLQPQRQLASAASKAARVRMTCNVHEHGKMPCPPMVTLSASLGKYK